MTRIKAWRYCCPLCQSLMVRRVRGERIQGKQYPFGRKGALEVAADRRKKFRCEHCSTRLEAVWDKKEQRETKRLDAPTEVA